MTLSDPAPVLIVDDDDLVRGILRSRLERMGIAVMVAASAEEALATMETTRLCALVLDIHMPGQSGMALAEFVRLFGSHLTGIPILIFTGTMLTPETLDLARRYDAELFQKPGGLHTLLHRLASLANPLHQLLRMDKPGSGRDLLVEGGREPNDYREPES